MDRQRREERDKQIQQSGEHWSIPAAKWGLSRQSVYRIRAKAPAAETHTAAAPMRFAQQAIKFKDRFTALASPGYSRHGGAVTEEFQRELQDDGGLKIFTEMAVHPIVSAVLFAIRMSLRRVKWWVPALDDTPDAKRKAEFVEECMEDMSQSWNEVMAQAFGMLKYGYVPSELIYKKRLGMTPPKYTSDPGRSRYSDGLIAWRRWQFINPLSLMSGNQWIFDENGRVQGINQLAPPDYVPVSIPIEKLLLFRTDVEWDNPEGISLLRPMYSSWYYSTNLAEIEAIGAERLGVGLPVVYLGDGVSKEGPGNDYDEAQGLVVNVRTDEQMGVVIPHAKMGSGAREGEGVLFELVSPPSRGFIDFSEAITRYEQRMAMTALAQFIFLGMGRVGTQALAGVSTDFFVEAVGAWADAVAEVINRFAIPRLMALNPFGLEDLPRLQHSEIGVPKLNEIADYINKLVGAQIILPYDELEKHLLELADLPEKPEGATLGRPQPQPPAQEPEAEEEMPEPPEEEDEEGEGGGGMPEESAEEYALRLKRGGPKWERATNAYQQELQSTYAAWADNAARELADIDDPEVRASREEELVAAIIAALIVIGRRRLPEALALGLAGEASSPAGMGILTQALMDNESYLNDSLLPAIRDKLRGAVERDPAIATDVVSLRAVLGTMNARVGNYAGSFWSTIMRGFLDRVQERADVETVGVAWVLDETAKHCPDCPNFAGEYENYEMMLAKTGGAIPGSGVQCNGNCRCHLSFKVPGKGWSRW